MPKNIYREKNEQLQEEANRLRRELDRLAEKVEIIRAMLTPVKDKEE
jgi:hypothetical protein